MSLFCIEGEIARATQAATSEKLRKQIQYLDLGNAGCLVVSEGEVLVKAVEDTAGGLNVVHAVHVALRPKVFGLRHIHGQLGGVGGPQ